MWKLALLVVVTLAAPAAALAKLQGDLRMCGAAGCRVVEKHRGHDAWPVLESLSRGRKLGPAPPGPFYRLALFDPDTRSEPIALYFIPNGAVTRVDGGTGGVTWVRLSVTPAVVARVARRLRPFPVPRITRGGPRLDLIMRDGEIVRVPHALAERIRHGESLR